jgi:DNA-binding transcriptional ArsR family regulator
VRPRRCRRRTYTIVLSGEDTNGHFAAGQATIWLHIIAMDAVFKALGDASRRKLLDKLHKNNGQTLGELCEHLDMTRQAVTKHLRLLEKANLVAVVWRGREKLHYLNPMPLHGIYERWIGKYERHRLQALSDLKKNLETKKS